jgi:aconitate hydratase
MQLPTRSHLDTPTLIAPLPADPARTQELVKGPNIVSLPDFDPLPDSIEATVQLKLGDDISTDEIMPAGAEVLPFRSNIPAISRFVFAHIDGEYAERVAAQANPHEHIVVGGTNYGQGSSREHAALAPRYLGLRVVIAKSFARIHGNNLANFGILPLEFADPDDYELLNQGDTLLFDGLRDALTQGGTITADNLTRHRPVQLHSRLTRRQVDAVLAGGQIPLMKATRTEKSTTSTTG